MTSRILFVDDDAMLLQFYRVIMERDAERWEASTSDDAHGALALLDKEPFDVLVSDYRMPGMDGVELMRHVSERHPRTARIMVSGVQDQEEVARCLGTTHQFLPKPFDIKRFRTALCRVGELNAFLTNVQLQATVAGLEVLPSIPSLYLKMMAEISREDTSLEDLAGIVAQDPGMTAKLLQIVNSAAFGRARRVSNPLEAIQYLGSATVHALVLSAHVFSAFGGKTCSGFSIQSSWDHAMQTASLARRILQAEGADPDLCEGAYTAGLLHDVGKVVLAENFTSQFQEALKAALDERIPVFEAEFRVFGADHAGIGAYLLSLWGLPAAIVEAVAFHHAPGRTDLRVPGPLLAVHAANVLAEEIASAVAAPPALDLEYLAALGLEEHVPKWRALAEKPS